MRSPIRWISNIRQSLCVVKYFAISARVTFWSSSSTMPMGMEVAKHTTMNIQNARPLLGTSLASGAALAGLGTVVLRGATRPFDDTVRKQFPRYRRSRTKRSTESLGPIGKTWLHLSVTGGVAAYLLLRGKGWDSAMTVILSSVASSGASGAAEKFLPRRHAPWGRMSVTEPSFPSGHALRAATVTLVTAYVLVRENVGKSKVRSEE